MAAKSVGLPLLLLCSPILSLSMIVMQRRRFPDFVELDRHLQPHVERRAAGPGGAGSSAGFDPNALELPAQVTTFYKNDEQVVTQRREGLQRYLNIAVRRQFPFPSF